MVRQEFTVRIQDLERTLGEFKSQNEIYRVDLESIVKSNEGTVKLDTELKKSFNSYKLQIKQQQSDLIRYKQMAEDAKRQLERYKQQSNHTNSTQVHKLQKSFTKEHQLLRMSLLG